MEGTKTSLFFLEGSGEMCQLTTDLDWENHPLGPPQHWPQSLKTTLGIILHSAFPMFLFWGADNYCFYNDAYRLILGNEGKHPAVGKKGQTVWPEIWATIEPFIESVIKTGQPNWFRDRLIPIFRNGSLENVYWTFSYSPVLSDEGLRQGVLVICMDTTDAVLTSTEREKRYQEKKDELSESHDQLKTANIYLQNIIDLFKEPLQVLKPIFDKGELVNFKYALTNAAYSSYANTTPANLKNRYVDEFFPGYFETSSFHNVKKVFLTGVPNTWDIHYNVDGLDLYNIMSATKLGDEVVVHFTDITKLKQLELELRLKIEELQQSNKNLEQFAYAASHDLKEPIRKIRFYSDKIKTLLLDKLEEVHIDLFNRIDTSSQRMCALIDDILDYSQVNLKPESFTTIDLNELISSVLNDLEIEIESKQAKIYIDKLHSLYGHKQQIRQAFQNLISNALKYSAVDTIPIISISDSIEKGFKTGLLLSSSEKLKDYVVITITDNGIGFDAVHADKIFNVFTRLHSNHTYSGTGIGLSIVKKVAENHKGYVLAESSPGKGAVFKLILPTIETTKI